MRHIRLKYFLTIILGLLMGCSQNDPELEPVDSEFLTLGCLFQEDVQFIVETEEEYFEMVRQIFDDRIGLDCIDTTQVPFDFNDYTLCGRYTKIDMNDKQTNGVYQDDILKKVTYKIDVDIVPGPENNGGFGKIYSAGMNWVKFLKPLDGYKIVIEYNEF